MADEDQRNAKRRYNLRSSSSNKRATLEGNEDSKLPALDQRQLDSIRNNRVELEAFQKQLIEDEIQKIGSSDLDKRDQYVKLSGKVEVFLDILNNEQVISRGTAVHQQHYPQLSSSSRHHLLSPDDDNATMDPDHDVETNSDNDSATVSDVDAMDFLDEELDASLDAIKPQIKKANRLILLVAY